MMKLKVMGVEDVAARHLCCGCGACAYVDGEHVEMVDVVEQGRRPRGRGEGKASAEALAVCPGAALEHTFDETMPGLHRELAAAWGPVLEVWEGHACDAEMRHCASSGGVASALALYCVEKGGMHGALHVTGRRDVPYMNQTVMSRSREELLAGAGSRYAPASPCEKLGLIETAPGACAFVGKPCDVAAVQKARALRKGLDEKVGVTISIFCAGTPSTRGTLELLKRMGVNNPAEVAQFRYRGRGWPGHTAVERHGEPAGGGRLPKLTYQESWAFLQRYRQWRCYVCVDHTGEFADIAVGDPWYRRIEEGEEGRSLVVVRTERGRRIVREAIAAGYVALERVGVEKIEASQPGFPTNRGSVWGRIAMCRLLGVATPVYARLPMFRFWWSRLTLKEKAQSIVGTVKRIFRKRLRQRAEVVAYEPTPAPCEEHKANEAA